MPRRNRADRRPTSLRVTRQAGLCLALLLAACTARAEGVKDGPLRLGPKPPAEPKRVVTLAPSLTELVLALGAGDRLIGVTRFDDAPEVKGLPRVGGYIDPSVEAVVALKPELVIVEPSPGNRAAVERMAKLGTPILAVPLQDVAQILAAMESVGAALGLRERGLALAGDTRARLEAVKARAAKTRPVRVLLVYDWEPLVVAGPGSFGDGLLKLTGATNAAQDARTAYPVYSYELAMKSAPEVIVDASDIHDPPRARILRLPGIAGARVVIASPSFFRPGPRIAAAAEELFTRLHPDAPRPEGEQK